jgi:hypothetical protein
VGGGGGRGGAHGRHGTPATRGDRSAAGSIHSTVAQTQNQERAQRLSLPGLGGGSCSLIFNDPKTILALLYCSTSVERLR